MLSFWLVFVCIVPSGILASVESCVHCEYEELQTGDEELDKQLNRPKGKSNDMNCALKPARILDTINCDICMTMDISYVVNLRTKLSSTPVATTIRQVKRGCGISESGDKLVCTVDTDSVKDLVSNLDEQPKYEMKDLMGGVCYCRGAACNVHVSKTGRASGFINTATDIGTALRGQFSVLVAVFLVYVALKYQLTYS